MVLLHRNQIQILPDFETTQLETLKIFFRTEKGFYKRRSDLFSVIRGRGVNNLCFRAVSLKINGLKV